MSLNEFEEKRLKEFEKQEGISKKSSDRHAGGADKKLLSGTVRFYEDILSSIPDSFIAVFNKTGKFLETWANRIISESTGIQTESFKGKSIQDVLDSKQAEVFLQHLLKAFDAVQPTEFSIEIRKNKAVNAFRVILSPLPVHTASPAAVSAVFILVRSGKRGEAETQQSPVSSLYISTDKEGIIQEVSPGFFHLSGYSKDQLISFRITHIPPVTTHYRTQFEKTLAFPDRTGRPYSFEWEWINNHGLTLWTGVACEAIFDGSTHTGFRYIFNDITEKKLLERNLIKARQTYKLIIENTGEGIFILQNDSVVFSNSRFTDIINLSFDRLQKGKFSDNVHPDDRGHFLPGIGTGYSLKTAAGDFVFRMVENQRTISRLRSRKYVIDWNQKPALLVYVTDITEQFKISSEYQKEIKDLNQMLEISIQINQISFEENILSYAGGKIYELSGALAVMMITYHGTEDAEIELIDCQHPIKNDLVSLFPVIREQVSYTGGFPQLRELSNGTLIKYNDGLFEEEKSLAQNRLLDLIGKAIPTGSIFLIGFSEKEAIYGQTLIFMPEGKKPTNPMILERLAQQVSIWLSRRVEMQEHKSNSRKYKRVFNSLMDIYFMVDNSGIITEVSPSMSRITGFAPEEVTGRRITDFYQGELTFEEFCKKLMQDEEITDYNIKYLHKSGDYLHGSLNVTLLKDQNQKTIGAEGFLRDISKRRKAEKEFRESEEKFRMLADFTYDWEYWISDENAIIYMSPSCERISGYTPDDFLQNPRLLTNIIHEDDYEIYTDHLKMADQSGPDEISVIDFRIITKKGDICWINQLVRKVFDAEGNSLGKRISNRDITEKKIAEQELKNSEERFRTLFYESPDACFVEDFDGLILDVNPAACKLHNMQRNELINKSLYDLVPDEDKEEVAKVFPKWFSGELQHYRGTTKTSDGRLIPVDIHGSRINFSGNQAMLFIVRDITDIVEKEKELKESIEKAEEADMLKSAFLANVSHEIRTPMNAIIGFSEILTNQELSQKEREEFIQYITQGSNTLMNLIEDIIDITKIEAGQIKIEFDDCNVGELLDELYATFLKMKNKNGHRDVDLRMNKPNVDYNFSIHTDPNRIRQILSNLLGNAIKFTKKGFIEFGYNLRSSNQIVFYVKDTGIGIPEDKLDLIFERFGQVNQKKNGNQQGTGLGLSISKKLAELLGGSLTVKSEAEVGSTFYLTLPVNDLTDTEERGSETLTKTISTYDWHDKLFLIAEDSILNYTFLEALFQRTKAKLLWAKNGREAVEMCRENEHIDLVLMDIKMPVLDGLQAIPEIKKFRKDLPIIVQTAYAMPEDREKSLAAGGDEHLNKPINADELFTTIARFLT